MTDQDPAAAPPRLTSQADWWGGLAMTAVGFVLENAVGGDHAFEYLMFFGGLSMGMAAGRVGLLKAQAREAAAG
jgi:hypothetical protein